MSGEKGNGEDSTNSLYHFEPREKGKHRIEKSRGEHSTNSHFQFVLCENGVHTKYSRKWKHHYFLPREKGKQRIKRAGKNIVQTAITISYHGKKVYIQNTVETIFYQEKRQT